MGCSTPSVRPTMGAGSRLHSAAIVRVVLLSSIRPRASEHTLWEALLLGESSADRAHRPARAPVATDERRAGAIIGSLVAAIGLQPVAALRRVRRRGGVALALRGSAARAARAAPRTRRVRQTGQLLRAAKQNEAGRRSSVSAVSELNASYVTLKELTAEFVEHCAPALATSASAIRTARFIVVCDLCCKLCSALQTLRKPAAVPELAGEPLSRRSVAHRRRRRATRRSRRHAPKRAPAHPSRAPHLLVPTSHRLHHQASARISSAQGEKGACQHNAFFFSFFSSLRADVGRQRRPLRLHVRRQP